jgi:hypothetical protein
MKTGARNEIRTGYLPTVHDITAFNFNNTYKSRGGLACIEMGYVMDGRDSIPDRG